MVLILQLYNDYLNRKYRKTLSEMSAGEKQELKERMTFTDKTDQKNPFFVYTH